MPDTERPAGDVSGTQSAELSTARRVVDWMLLRPGARFGAIGATAIATGAQLLKSARPSSAGQIVISVAVSLLLSLVVTDDRVPPERRRLAGSIALAYVLMAALYLVDFTKAFVPPDGYEAITEACSSLCFLGAWWIAIVILPRGDRPSDYMLSCILLLLLILASAMAFFSEIGGPSHSTQHATARLLVNITNGGIMFGLYHTLTRVLGKADPLTHVAIVLYACAQIAAYGRDCLAANTCNDEFGQMAAMLIAWLLLLGKVCLGWYVATGVYAQNDLDGGRA